MTAADRPDFERFLYSPAAFAPSEQAHKQRFPGGRDLLSLWVAEPYVPAAPVIQDALSRRANVPWYGYENASATRTADFWAWMQRRHGWRQEGLHVTDSHSVGTSVGGLIELFTEVGDSVILQPPVFTGFKDLITSAGRRILRNPLTLQDGCYRMDFEGLAELAARPEARMLILCNPHNPVGRAWSLAELENLAAICSEHEVFVVADEIHADLTLGTHSFVPFATAVPDEQRWAATHGPNKSFGLGGLADSVLIAADSVTERFRALSSRLQLSRGNVLSSVATSAAYQHGDDWLDELLALTESNVELLVDRLPDELALLPTEATYLGWLDFRELGLPAPDLQRWLVESARLALSPGHWFGREGSGFARMTLAAPSAVVAQAADQLREALQRT